MTQVESELKETNHRRGEWYRHGTRLNGAFVCDLAAVVHICIADPVAPSNWLFPRRRDVRRGRRSTVPRKRGTGFCGPDDLMRQISC